MTTKEFDDASRAFKPLSPYYMFPAYNVNKALGAIHDSSYNIHLALSNETHESAPPTRPCKHIEENCKVLRKSLVDAKNELNNLMKQIERVEETMTTLIIKHYGEDI